MTADQRAWALRREHRQIAQIAERMHRRREEANALIADIIAEERYPGELDDDIREAVRLRDRFIELERWYAEQRYELAVLCAAADDPF